MKKQELDRLLGVLREVLLDQYDGQRIELGRCEVGGVGVWVQYSVGSSRLPGVRGVAFARLAPAGLDGRQRTPVRIQEVSAEREVWHG